MGELVREQKSWESGGFTDGERIRIYASLDGTVTVNELIEILHAREPGKSMDDFHVAFSTVRWSRPATEEELEAKRIRNEKSDARRREWASRSMREMVEQFGPDTSTWPMISQEELDQFRADNPQYRRAYW